MQSAAAKIEEINDLIGGMDEEEKAELDELLSSELPIWVPLPGPQTKAYESEADIVYYGGSAGGGKTDLLLGLGLTQHKHSIIYRRQSTQLIGIQSRLLDEIVKSRRGWNGQDDILKLADLKIEFGSCNNAGEEIKYQGRPHDLVCVEKGTPVRMANGSYLPIESVTVGDYVDTLEGSNKVTRTIRRGMKPAVRVDAIRDGKIIASQVQSPDHAVMSDSGWISYADTVYEFLPAPDTFSPTAHHDVYRYGVSSLRTYEPQPLLRAIRWLGLGRLLKQCQYLVGYQSRLDSSFDEALLNPGNDFARFVYQLSKIAQRFLLTDLQGRLQPSLALVSQGAYLPQSLHDDNGDLGNSSLGYYQDSYLTGKNLYGGQSLPSEVVGLICPQRLNDVELQNPSYFANGDLVETPKHNLRSRQYIHPYTKEMRQTDSLLCPVSLSFTPIGKKELFDLTINNVNHYITGSVGFVNKNCFDEITHFLESQFRFLIGWMRTTVPGQRCRIVCAGNPPTTTEGQWVVKYWAPWLDPQHPNPAKPGELRWFTTIEGKDQECADGKSQMINGRIARPLSRTFISSRVTDNPFLMRTGYEATLQSLPEPLRSQMLNGDFAAGMEDSAWQVIPTAWVDAAMDRWKENGKVGQQMDSVGVDVARGGKDKTVVAPRYGTWYDQIKAVPGSKTPDGATAAGFVVSCLRDKAVVHVDALGVGGETIGHLETNGLQVDAVVGYDTDSVIAQHDKATGRLKFRNRRAMSYWRFRESLDPVTGDNISLPPDPELKADLCCAMWKLTTGGILIEQKDEIKKRIGRSPDKGDAVIYASINTIKKGTFRPGQKNVTEAEEWGPFDD